MHDTDATMITSRRSNRARVALWRRRSISSLRVESFSMYVSERGQVGLGLEVVVVADEVLDRVLGEELAELLVQLRGEGLVVGHHQGRSLHRLDHLGRGEGLAGPGRPQQDLVLQPAPAARPPARRWPGAGLRWARTVRAGRSRAWRDGRTCFGETDSRRRVSPVPPRPDGASRRATPTRRSRRRRPRERPPPMPGEPSGSARPPRSSPAPPGGPARPRPADDDPDLVAAARSGDSSSLMASITATSASPPRSARRGGRGLVAHARMQDRLQVGEGCRVREDDVPPARSPRASRTGPRSRAGLRRRCRGSARATASASMIATPCSRSMPATVLFPQPMLPGQTDHLHARRPPAAAGSAGRSGCSAARPRSARSRARTAGTAAPVRW